MAWGRRGRFEPIARASAAAVACVVLAQCSGGSNGLFPQIDPRYGVSASPRVVEPGQPVPKGGGAYRVGKPYIVGGRLYVPEEDVNYSAEGLASFYGTDFHGRRTANGEVFDMHSVSAAHPTLPMPSYVRVTNLDNRRSMVVRVNDRGPYHPNRLIDVSIKAADMLGFQSTGTARVRVEYIGKAPLEGSDDGILMATLRQGQPAPAPSLVMVAATRPFLPDLRTAGNTPRGGVPLPPERPFNLGIDDTPAAGQRRSGLDRSSRHDAPKETRTAGRSAPKHAAAKPGHSTVVAYVPASGSQAKHSRPATPAGSSLY